MCALVTLLDEEVKQREDVRVESSGGTLADISVVILFVYLLSEFTTGRKSLFNNPITQNQSRRQEK